MSSPARANEVDHHELVARYQGLARQIAGSVHARVPSRVDRDELSSAAMNGLYDAVRRYDPSRGIQFRTYAKHRIRGAVVDALRALDWAPTSVRRRQALVGHAKRVLGSQLGREPSRAEIALHLDISEADVESATCEAADGKPLSLDAPVGGDADAPTLAETLSHTEEGGLPYVDGQTRGRVIEVLRGLPDRERTAIMLYFLEEMPLKEVGAELGVTESRASQLCTEGIARLRLRLGVKVAAQKGCKAR